jgi:hypothetical protein
MSVKAFRQLSLPVANYGDNSDKTDFYRALLIDAGLAKWFVSSVQQLVRGM